MNKRLGDSELARERNLGHAARGIPTAQLNDQLLGELRHAVRFARSGLRDEAPASAAVLDVLFLRATQKVSGVEAPWRIARVPDNLARRKRPSHKLLDDAVRELGATTDAKRAVPAADNSRLP